MTILRTGLNFLQAVQHAIIGYSIKRAIWPEEVDLSIGQDLDTLVWPTGTKRKLTAKDMMAEDWEAKL
jgi:hypothetical protein